MVNNLQNLCLFNSLHGLGKLVVVHKDDLLAACIHDVVTGHIAQESLIVIDDRIGVVAAAQHLAPRVLHKFRRIELDGICRHDLGYSRGKIYISRGIHCPVSRDDHVAMAFPCHLQDLRRHAVRAYDDHCRGSLVHQIDLRLGIASCDDDPVLDVEFREVFTGDGNNAHLSVRSGFRVLIDDPAVDRGADTLQRCILEES